ncbi:hypothetical protein MMC07_004781 [Pseudocyphellaria aurata]|nr:hypothetical protein [Pseudocyphellaria aurata]
MSGPNLTRLPDDILLVFRTMTPHHGSFTNLTDKNDDLADRNNKPTCRGPVALALLMLGICLASFIMALDRTIVATVIPCITDDFSSAGVVGWYGSADLLTSCAFHPSYGQGFSHFDARWSFLTALGLFELG